jgi:uncharacterized protein YwgA
LTVNRDIPLLIAVFGLHQNKTIAGRTRIQKEVCLLKFKSQLPFTFEYKSYFYGPYSEELSDTINTLVGVKLLEETVTSIGYNSYRYNYSLTKQGEELFTKISQEDGELIGKISAEIKAFEAMPTPELVATAKSASGLKSIGCQYVP